MPCCATACCRVRLADIDPCLPTCSLVNSCPFACMLACLSSSCLPSEMKACMHTDQGGEGGQHKGQADRRLPPPGCLQGKPFGCWLPHRQWAAIHQRQIPCSCSPTGLDRGTEGSAAESLLNGEAEPAQLLAACGQAGARQDCTGVLQLQVR